MFATDIYGTAPTYNGAVLADTAATATDSVHGGVRELINPRNPLVWVGVLILVTAGAAGVAGSVKLGPAKIGGSIGKSS